MQASRRSISTTGLIFIPYLLGHRVLPQDAPTGCSGESTENSHSEGVGALLCGAPGHVTSWYPSAFLVHSASLPSGVTHMLEFMTHWVRTHYVHQKQAGSWGHLMLHRGTVIFSSMQRFTPLSLGPWAGNCLRVPWRHHLSWTVDALS